MINKNNRINGFTMIELLIGMSILGILSSIALSSYKGHNVRTRIIEGVHATMDLKTQIREVTTANELLVLASTWNSNDVYNGTASTSKFVEKIEVDPATAVITVSFIPATVGVEASENEITYSPFFNLAGNLLSFEDGLAQGAKGSIDFACASASSLRIQERGLSGVVTLPTNGVLTKYVPSDCK